MLSNKTNETSPRLAPASWGKKTKIILLYYLQNIELSAMMLSSTIPIEIWFKYS